jgi:polar amino acid transport system substrate-binding protein
MFHTSRQSVMSIGIAALLTAALWFSIGRAAAQPADTRIAPKGELRAALQTFNPLLVSRSAEGEFSGVSVDLATALGKKLGVPVKWVPYDNIARYNQSLGKDEWDVAFSPRDLSRIGQLAFSDAIMEVDNSYVVRPGSFLRSPDEVDRSGITVAVAQGSPADSYLTRTFRSAQIARLYGGLVTAKDALTFGRADAYADYTHLAYRVAAEVPGATVLVSRFNVLRMAIALPKANAAALPLVNDFIKESKRDGVITEYIKRAGLRGVRTGLY